MIHPIAAGTSARVLIVIKCQTDIVGIICQTVLV